LFTFLDFKSTVLETAFDLVIWPNPSPEGRTQTDILLNPVPLLTKGLKPSGYILIQSDMPQRIIAPLEEELGLEEILQLRLSEKNLPLLLSTSMIQMDVALFKRVGDISVFRPKVLFLKQT
jgi:hypothetical protein